MNGHDINVFLWAIVGACGAFAIGKAAIDSWRQRRRFEAITREWRRQALLRKAGLK